jgi:hypothetical protein
MDGGRAGRRLWILGLMVAAASGCARDRPIKPFGSVRTYNETIVPGPQGHPRGKMVTPQAPGIDLVHKPGAVGTPPVASPPTAFDAAARPAGVVNWPDDLPKPPQ